MEECVCEESVCVYQTIPLPQSLSAPQPEFETDQRTWSNCLLLHWLLIIGDEEQVLLREGSDYQIGWIFGEVPKGGRAVIFNQKIYIADFVNFKQGFLMFEHEIDTKE